MLLNLSKTPVFRLRHLHLTRLVSNAFSKTLVKKIRLGGIVLENETNNDSSILLVSPGLNRRVDRGQTQLSRARKRHTCIVKIANLHIDIIGAFKRNIVAFVSSIDIFDLLMKWSFMIYICIKTNNFDSKITPPSNGLYKEEKAEVCKENCWETAECGETRCQRPGTKHTFIIILSWCSRLFVIIVVIMLIAARTWRGQGRALR